jgi:hypothetical protein
MKKNSIIYENDIDKDIKNRIKALKKFGKTIDSKEKAVKALINLGIYDKNRKLTKNFGG